MAANPAASPWDWSRLGASIETTSLAPTRSWTSTPGACLRLQRGRDRVGAPRQRLHHQRRDDHGAPPARSPADRPVPSAIMHLPLRRVAGVAGGAHRVQGSVYQVALGHRRGRAALAGAEARAAARPPWRQNASRMVGGARAAPAAWAASPVLVATPVAPGSWASTFSRRTQVLLKPGSFESGS